MFILFEKEEKDGKVRYAYDLRDRVKFESRQKIIESKKKNCLTVSALEGKEFFVDQPMGNGIIEENVKFIQYEDFATVQMWLDGMPFETIVGLPK